MTLLIGLDTSKPIHRAATLCRRSCAFTGNALGYQTLLKWSGQIAGSEPVVYVMTGTGRAAAVLADWLQGCGLDVLRPTERRLPA